MKYAGSLIMLTAITLAAVWPAGAEAAKWSLQSATVPSGAYSGVLTDISCGSAKACMAVGSYDDYFLPFADEEEAGTWTVRSMVTPTGATEAEALGVSCFSKTACMAVGVANSTADPAFAEFWNGTSWAVQSPIEPSGATLDSVSCIRAYACYAVGAYIEAGKVVPLAEFRSGSEWVKLKAFNPTGSEFAWLKSVSCTYGALYTCTAVGVYHAGGVVKPLAERYNGHEWSSVSTVNPTGSASAEFSRVSCYGVNECLAVGTYETSSATKTLIERLGPTLTSLESSTNGGTASTTLKGVSCPTSESCLAVGFIGAGTEPFSEHSIAHEGKEWANISTPSQPSTVDNELESVSCSAASVCVAVGQYFSSGEEHPLAEGYE